MSSALVWDASLRILAVGAAAGLYLAIRRPGAAMRHAVWTAVCVSMLLMPVLMAIGPQWKIGPPAVMPSPWQEVEPGITGSVRSVQVLTPTAPQSVDWLPYCYIAGVAFFLLRLAAGRLGLRRLLREARPLSELDAWESERLRVPVTVRGRVLLPARWREWEPWQLRAVLAHERAHIQRRDWWFAQLALVNRAVFWFHPLAWYVERMMAHAAEHACDDAASVHAPDASSYAAMLVEFAAARPGASRVAVAMARPSGLAARVERLLLETQRAPVPVTRSVVAAIVLLAVPAAALSFAPRLVVAQQPQPAMTPGLPDIRVIEERIARTPADMEARALKVVYLRDQGRLDEATNLIVWIIDHHPGDQYARIMSGGGFGPFDEKKIQDAWERAVQRQPANGEVLLSAGSYWMYRNLARSEDLLRRAQIALPEDPLAKELLGRLLARIAFGGPGVDAASTERVRRELETTSSAWLVGEVARALRIRILNGDNRHIELSDKYLDRARQLEPENPRWRSRAPRAIQKK